MWVCERCVKCTGCTPQLKSNNVDPPFFFFMIYYVCVISGLINIFHMSCEYHNFNIPNNCNDCR